MIWNLIRKVVGINKPTKAANKSLQMHYRKDSAQTGLFQLPFIFYWRKEISLLFIVSKAVDAVIFMQKIHCLFMSLNRTANSKLFYCGVTLKKAIHFNMWYLPIVGLQAAPLRE